MTNTTTISALIEQLHEVNRQLSEAARPLDRLDELDSEQRKQLGQQIRAGLEQWDNVSKQISQVLTQTQDEATP